MERRQKQKVAILQRKLTSAQHALLEDQEEVEKLRMQLCDAQLEAVNAKISSVEEKWQMDPDRLVKSIGFQTSSLFLEEREVLHEIIQSGPQSVRAQELLDRILQMITQLSNAK